MSNLNNLSRRSWLQMTGLGVSAGSMSGWLKAMAADAAKHPQRTKSVILLWLNGGPSTIDLWDLKPGTENGGPFQEIGTAVSGVRISEHLPKTAQCMNEMVIVRSMTSKEGDHNRATAFVKTGYLPAASIQFPPLGALVAHELASKGLLLPSFVSIAPGKMSRGVSGGFLGPRFAPLEIAIDSPGQAEAGAAGVEALKVDNLALPKNINARAQQSRLTLLGSLNDRFAASHESVVIESLRSATARAVQMMDPAAAAAFDLEQESEKLRDSYGRGLFGQGCLLARRLVERGVSFVEVNLDGWDTHQDNFERVRGLSQTLDSGFAALLRDLRDRGLLESTLVLCQGEFGRTPQIHGTGRDHWPQAWSTVLAGGGIRGGQVVGSTTAKGMEVASRPVTVPDVMATVCQAIGIDPKKQNTSNVGRPIRIADPDAVPIAELL